MSKIPANQTRYLNNEPSIDGLFDEEGYFRTGDIAHQEGIYYFFDGRGALDCKLCNFRVLSWSFVRC